MSIGARTPQLGDTREAKEPPSGLSKSLLFVVTTLAVVVAGMVLFSSPAHAVTTFTVDSTADTDQRACTAAADDCTLRGAINAANAAANSGGPDLIEFDIPGSGVKTIGPQSPLPEITEAVTIDGYSQEGASENTQEVGSDAVLLIELNGSGAGINSSGLVIEGDESTMRGLVINRFSGAGITVAAGASGNTIAGNYIGTNADGEEDLGNPGFGVYIQDAPDNTVGGAEAASRNVISGNDGSTSILILGVNASGNEVVGNYIGTDAQGEQDLGNTGNGVYIANAPGNTVGGEEAGARNVISANDQDGVVIALDGASGNEVKGNYIGTDASGSQDLGNTSDGVYIFAPENTVGGEEDGKPNLIAFNSANGVMVLRDNSTGNAILSNSIHSNGALGIDLADDGVTQNDPDDPGSGPNNLQNYPVLDSATTNAAGTTTVSGSLNSTPLTTFTVQFFSSPEADPSGFGEGETFLGEQTVTTDADGDAEITFTSTQLSEGEFVSATATSAPTATNPNDTSEFSGSIAVETNPPPSLSINDVTVSEGDSGTTEATFTVTRSGDTSGASTVDFATQDGTATSPEDYQQSSGTLTFAPGETEQTITVLVNGDTRDEPDETFSVELSDAQNATISDGEGTGTITDDERPCTKTGTAGNDKIKGTNRPDVLCGLGGNDKLYGRGEGDELYGDAGRDTLTGGQGNDTIYAKDGEVDTIICNRGTDTVVADRSDKVSRGCENVSYG